MERSTPSISIRDDDHDDNGEGSGKDWNRNHASKPWAGVGLARPLFLDKSETGGGCWVVVANGDGPLATGHTLDPDAELSISSTGRERSRGREGAGRVCRRRTTTLTSPLTQT